MCGLVGVAGNLTATSTKIMAQMLIADQFRGMHSTGVASIKDNSVATYKRAMNASDFLQLKRADSLLDIYADAIIGHNRAATQGQVNDENAHPFTHGDVTLVHNGTLVTQRGLPKHSQFTVDSENIAYAMSQLGAKDVLEELDGAFSLVWHDTRNNTLNFARNDERPLCLAYAHGIVYWASEELMLRWLLDRNKIHNPVFMTLPVGQHHVLDLSKKITGFDSLIFKRFTPKETYSYYHYPAKSAHKPGRTGNVSDYVVEQLGKDGYKMDQELDFVASKFEAYSQNSSMGNLFGNDITNNKGVIIYGVSRNQVTMEPNTDQPSPDYLYTSTVSGRTTWGSSRTPITCLSSSRISKMGFAELNKGAGVEEYYEKKHSPSSNEQLEDINVDGVLFLSHEIPEVIEHGCAWCGDPFDMAALLDAKVAENGEPIHRDVCWEQYEELVEVTV